MCSQLGIALEGIRLDINYVPSLLDSLEPVFFHQYIYIKYYLLVFLGRKVNNIYFVVCYIHTDLVCSRCFSLPKLYAVQTN